MDQREFIEYLRRYIDERGTQQDFAESTNFYPQRFEVNALQQAGVVQVGSNNKYSEPKTLGVGESATWFWGDMEITVKRVRDEQVRNGKVIPFARFKRMMRKKVGAG